MPDDARAFIAGTVPALEPEPIINKRIRQYRQLRDKINEMKARHEAEMKPLTSALLMLNNELLKHLTDIGGDSITVKGVGTAYKTVKATATIADAAEFKRHVIGTQSWDLADWRANSVQVAAFLTEHNVAPPGVNYRSVALVGVRRPADEGDAPE